MYILGLLRMYDQASSKEAVTEHGLVTHYYNQIVERVFKTRHTRQNIPLSLPEIITDRHGYPVGLLYYNQKKGEVRCISRSTHKKVLSFTKDEIKVSPDFVRNSECLDALGIRVFSLCSARKTQYLYTFSFTSGHLTRSELKNYQNPSLRFLKPGYGKFTITNDGIFPEKDSLRAKVVNKEAYKSFRKACKGTLGLLAADIAFGIDHTESFKESEVFKRLPHYPNIYEGTHCFSDFNKRELRKKITTEEGLYDLLLSAMAVAVNSRLDPKELLRNRFGSSLKNPNSSLITGLAIRAGIIKFV